MSLFTPVIVQAPAQRLEVERLAAYARELDGAILKVIDQNQGLERPYPDRNNQAFRQAAVAMKGQPFIWMEPDAIPRKQGWLHALTQAYLEAGKEFLLSSDQNPPFDLVGGIGVYGPNSDWLIPGDLQSQGWDAWMAKHLKPLTAFTRLIQHTNGNYNEFGVAAPHRFPEDNHLLRPDAVLFHADRLQQLIPGGRRTQRFYHTGDLGDIVAALPVIRQLGGGELIVGNHSQANVCWRAMEGARFDAIKPLIENQPYISAARFEREPQAINYDLSGFRKVYSRQYNLSQAQAKWLGIIDLDLDPWLEVSPSRESAGRIIVARSGRYHNPRFPWKQLVRMHGRRMSFVGLPEEFSAFVRGNGGAGMVSYLRTNTLLELASLIKGSELFIGNQSCPCWIAMGLGHRMIQETHQWIHDSIVPRENARFYSGSNRSCFADFGLSV